jgi:type I restriction enzyme M protein
MANKDDLISIADIARILEITRQGAKKLIGKKPQPKREVGGSFLYDIEDLPSDVRERLRDAQKGAVATAIKAGSAGHKDINFEKELWAAADKLRGNIDASEYKNIVLGLLFLKYISDAFYKRREEIEEKTRDPKNKQYYMADEKARAQVLDLKDFYTSATVFYVPEKSRWEYLQSKASSAEIGQILDKAMEYIESDNRSQLEGVLPKIYAKANLDHAVIAELINIFSRIKFDHDFDREKDILGRIYEYFLGQFASAEGKRGGEFFTARSIVKLLVEILEPYENARVFDPAAGSGGMFVSMSLESSASVSLLRKYTVKP